MGRKSSRNSGGLIAGVVAIIAAILIICALAINVLFLYSYSDDDISFRYGYDESNYCITINDDESCVTVEYDGDVCDSSLCDGCDACKYYQAATTWLSLNIIALILIVIAAIILLAAMVISKLNDFAKYTKFLLFGAAILLIIALCVFYIVASDVGIYDTDSDDFGITNIW